MKWALLFLVACSGRATPVTGGGGPSSPASGECEALRGKLEKLYRDEAEAKEPKHVEGAVADNTAMVLADCAKEPGKVAPCVQLAASVAEIESKCVRPIDDEGSEGNDLK